GEANMHDGSTADAEECLRQALGHAGRLGMRLLAAHCHLGLGKLYQRTGKPERAEEHLTTATAMYREMDMRLWLEKAEAETMEPGAWPICTASAKIIARAEAGHVPVKTGA